MKISLRIMILLLITALHHVNGVASDPLIPSAETTASQPSLLQALYNLSSALVQNVGGGTLTACSRPLVWLGSLVHTLGTLADVYVVQYVEQHPYRAGLATLLTAALVLRGTQWGCELCETVGTLFGYNQEEDEYEHDRGFCCR